MQKVLSRKIVLIIIICMSLTLAAIPVYAVTDFGVLDYWYSDTNSIGYLGTNQLKRVISSTSGCNMPPTTVLVSGDFGVDAWSSSEDLTLNDGSPTDYNLIFIGATREFATSQGWPVNALAVGGASSRTLVGTALNPSGTKVNVYNMSNPFIYFIWDETGANGAAITSTFSDAKWKAIGAHEFGHACGYIGHDSGASSTNKSLMYTTIQFFDSWNVSTPQTRDLNHMGGV